MAKIKQVKARQILDSKGNPTIETTIILNNDASVSCSVPAGTSVGTYEAAEIRDNDTHYAGKGVLKAVDNVEKVIGPQILGLDPTRQQEIDKLLIEMDGTQNKSRLGANAILSVSIAVAKAGAKISALAPFLYIRQFIEHTSVPLKTPAPMFNILNGGLHGEDNTNFQEYLAIPQSSLPFKDALERGVAIYNSLRKTLKTSNFSTLIGDEGGFSPTLATNIDGLILLKQSATDINLQIGFDIFLGIDAAAGSFYQNGRYVIKDKSQALTSRDIIDYYESINKEFNLLYFEDPLYEDDWDGWADLNKKISQNTIVVGDDLTATNPYRLQMAINKQAISGIIIKPNQIGTILETLAVVEMARASGLKIIVSHRSGETNDDFIADLAVGVSADYTKFGAPVRGERVAKYNRMLAIANQIANLEKK